MQPERRRQMVLAVLVVVLAGLLYRAWSPTAAPTPGASNPRTVAKPGQPREPAAPDVNLEALESERPKPSVPSTTKRCGTNARIWSANDFM